MNKGHRGQHNYYPQQPLPDIVHFPGAPGAQPNQSALTGHGLQAMQSMQAPQQMQQVNAVHTQHPRFQTTHAGNRRHNSPALMPPRQANIVQHQPAITSQANQVASGYQINQMMPPMIGFQRQPYNNAQYFVVQHPIQTTGPYYPFINQAAFVGMHQPPQNVQVRSTGPSSLMTQHGSNMSISQPSGSYPSSSETPTQSNENMVSYQPQQRPPEPKRERKGAVIQDPNSGHVFTEQELKSTEPVRQEAVLSEPQADASSSRNTPSNQSVISSSEAALEFRDKVSAAAASGTSQAGRSAAVEDHPPLVNSDECKTVTNVLDNSKINETPPDIGVSSAILNEDRVNEVEQISEETLNCVDDVKEPSPVLHQTDSTEEDSVNYHNEASTSDLVDNLRTVQETPKTESESEDTTKSDITNMTISNEQNGEVVDSVANVPPLVTPESNFKEEQITSKDKEEVAVDANKSEEINLSNEEKPSLVDEQTESGGKSESAENPSLPVPSPVLETNHAENELKDNVSSAGVQQNEKAKPEVLKVDASSQLNKNELSDKKGKYAYDPAFLKSLQNHPASMKKPDTLPKLDIIHDMPIPLRHTEPSDRYNRHSNAGVVDFLPHYMNVPPGRNPSRSSSQRGDRSGRGSQPNRPIKIISPSLTQDVKLHTVDNAWKPQLKSTESADEEAKTQELFKAFRGILNKLTPQKYSKLLDEVKKLNIDTEHRLKGILDLIFDKAVDEPAFCLQYANLCKHLATLKVVKVDENGAEKQVKFSPLLLTRCQKEFESKMYEGIDIEGKQKIIDETTDEEKKKLLLAELDEEKRRARKRSLGNIKLIGELYKLNMLTGNIMMSCVEKLLRDGEEESLECLCALLRTIGEKLEEDTKKYEQKHNLRTSIMAPYFSTLSDFVEQKKTSARVRFMIQDILDMRANNWQARKIQDENKPKTIDEIHSEAQEEEKKKMLELQQHSQKRQESLKKGGDWKNKNTQTVNMLKNLKNSSTTEQLQFGPGHAFANSWSQGARGGSQQKESIRLPSNESDRKGQRAGVTQRDSSKGQSRSQNLPQTDTMRNIIPSQDSSDQWVKKPVGRNNPPFASDYAVKQPRGSRNSSMEKGSAPSSRGSSIKKESLKKEAESESVPELSTEKFESKSIELIGEFLNNRNLEESVLTLKQFCNEQSFPMFVSNTVNHALELSSHKDQLAVGELLSHLVVNNIFSKEKFYIGLDMILQLADDVVVDVPKFFEYMGNLLSPLFLSLSDVLRKPFFKNALKSCIISGKGGKLLSHVLKSASSSTSASEVGSLWKSGNLSLSDFLLPEENEEEFVERNDLKEIFSSVKSSSGIDSSTLNDRKSMKLNKFDKFFDMITMKVQQNESTECIIELIEKNFQAHETKDPDFVSALTKAVVKGCVNSCGEESTRSYTVEVSRLVKKCPLLVKYCENEEKREAKSLLALQDLSEELQHPSKMLNQIFQTLFEENVISQDAFLQWEQQYSMQPGKAVAVMACKQFLTWLKETEDSDDEDLNNLSNTRFKTKTPTVNAT